MPIREAIDTDFDRIWPFFEEIVCKGDTYGYAQHLSRQEAYALWMQAPRKTYVFADADQHEVQGSYYLKTNHEGPGQHVCNCGYMVSSKARGQGIATQMCQHSQKIALELGYKAMQFNFVASTNTGALHLWNKLGFNTVGRLPKAFCHPVKGYVDALILYKWLAN